MNCLVPQDPNIRIMAQKRNYSQSSYVLEYEQTDVRPAPATLELWRGRLFWLGAIVLLMLMLKGIARRRSGLESMHPELTQEPAVHP